MLINIRGQSYKLFKNLTCTLINTKIVKQMRLWYQLTYIKKQIILKDLKMLGAKQYIIKYKYLLHIFFILIYLANIFISMVPTGAIQWNPFQNIFLADSYAYFCEIWRRANISDISQTQTLNTMFELYSNSTYTCHDLLNSYYPGAPIFSRISFILPLQTFAHLHPLIGPLFVHFLFQIILLIFILKLFSVYEKSIFLKLSSIIFFLNPSLVYPIFAFSTEKYQIFTISILYYLFTKNSTESAPRNVILITLGLIYLMLLRENFFWSLFFLILYTSVWRKRSYYLIVLWIGLTVLLHLFQAGYSFSNTPDYISNYGGNRSYDQTEAVKRVFSNEFMDLLNSSIGADIRAALSNLTVLDIVSAALFFSFLIMFLINITNFKYIFLVIFLFFIGIFQTVVSVAFFTNTDLVTFFRLFLPSFWCLIILNADHKSYSTKVIS